MARRALSRTLAAAILWSFPVLLFAAPAGAAVTGPCDGSATIEGVTYTPANDTPGNPVALPDKEGVVASWEGSTDGPIHNHNGEIGVDVGPFTIPVADWAGENKKDEVQKKGEYQLDDAYAKLPLGIVGLFRVSGSHIGDEASCEGFVYVKIEGNPLSTVPGVAAAALTTATAALVAAAGVARRPGP
ncbi:MAG: hypothetical protein HYU54_07400 [Actinobacteria bacterium]|nr:hypothetical protein [Actinomycetota bacterium]